MALDLNRLANAVGELQYALMELNLEPCTGILVPRMTAKALLAHRPTNLLDHGYHQREDGANIAHSKVMGIPFIADTNNGN